MRHSRSWSLTSCWNRDVSGEGQRGPHSHTTESDHDTLRRGPPRSSAPPPSSCGFSERMHTCSRAHACLRSRGGRGGRGGRGSRGGSVGQEGSAHAAQRGRRASASRKLTKLSGLGGTGSRRSDKRVRVRAGSHPRGDLCHDLRWDLRSARGLRLGIALADAGRTAPGSSAPRVQGHSASGTPGDYRNRAVRRHCDLRQGKAGGPQSHRG